ncbi:hypothetical protein KAFR_0D02160 [Kazachstania africana CBS 2517]|uniref:Ubiquitin carboxyl-terminal hydrolase n=1 Tax=Kazachstania africana (strain ATCC 22294 / BCRC 22015 / CBS 2517 / CECT 1963 / NBRC 1671 / NRRL Y-8276) TaxID=1071382 RepID=H2AU13_KAZAF|nr:hypothetical protein KAFR_0D02160 [Kazachstania africana CBS 2517]CCF57863.1 hypothetical protein KAFR_0D02160 [Kazachstania africana CBS 2517]
MESISLQHLVANSDELTKLVVSIYNSKIKPIYKQLLTLRPIDLLEYTEQLFEYFLKGNTDSLDSFIIGYFYISLVIPTSHAMIKSSNNDYIAIYQDLKKYYESQPNLSDLLFIIRSESENILQSFDVDAPSSHSQHEEDNTADSSTTIWQAPFLEPNDQLKLAIISSESELESETEVEAEIDINANESKYTNFINDKTINDEDTYLKHLYEECFITPHELFSILSNPSDRLKILIIDLRLSRYFNLQTIRSPNLIKFDPIELWNNRDQTPVLHRTSLFSNPLFQKIDLFSYIIIYSDNETTTAFESFEYNFSFFKLLMSSSMKVTPNFLLGGFEKWEQLISSYSEQYGIETSNYIFTNNKRFTEPPSWNPPPVPHEIRKRPPPPPPPNLPSRTYSTRHTQGYREQQQQQQQHHHNHRPKRIVTRYTKYGLPHLPHSSNLYVQLSISGLRNLGNTCYINSMLQCLFATTAFRNLFLSNRYKEYIGTKVDPHLSNSFHILFRKMYLNGGCAVIPVLFLKTCNFLRPDLRIPDVQQDTQEFLILLLDQLHNELKSNQDRLVSEHPDLIEYDTDSMDVENANEYKKWFAESLENEGLSLIHEIFQGQLENSLECQRCNYTSTNYSNFCTLSLSIPNKRRKFRKLVDLEDCISLFIENEMLTGENAWNCPKCSSSSNNNTSKRKSRGFFKFSKHKNRSHNDLTFSEYNHNSSSDDVKFSKKKLVTRKSTSFIKLPNLLIIHLSRFSMSGLLDKNNTDIAYPAILTITLKNKEKCRFKLYGVVNHFGNLNNGHYTSLINKEPSHDLNPQRQKWFYFDDETVKQQFNYFDLDKNVNRISSSDVYVLFYEKIIE